MKKNPKYLILEAAIVLFAISLLLWYAVPRFLESQNINTVENFPDPQVRRAVEKFMGVEENGYFTQRQARIKIDSLALTPYANSILIRPRLEFKHYKNGKSTIITGISNLSGIQFFSSITGLSFVATEKITELNLLHHTHLKSINIWGANINNASFAICNELKRLTLFHCNLKHLSITTNTILTYLNVSHNHLSGLFIENNPKLQVIVCDNNQIDKLDLSNHQNLEMVIIRNNNIREIDLSSSPKIYQIDVSNNPLMKLDLRKHYKLTTLIIDEEQLYNAAFLLHPSVRRSSEFIISVEPKHPNQQIQNQQDIQAQIQRILQSEKPASASTNSDTSTKRPLDF